MPGQREKYSLGLLSDNEDAISCSSLDPSVTANRNSSRFRQYLVEKKQKKLRMYCLIFLEKSLGPSKATKSDGICLDQAQINILGEILALFKSRKTLSI